MTMYLGKFNCGWCLYEYHNDFTWMLHSYKIFHMRFFLSQRPTMYLGRENIEPNPSLSKKTVVLILLCHTKSFVWVSTYEGMKIRRQKYVH